jgi:hypothetical protein
LCRYAADATRPQVKPQPVEDIVAAIKREKPAVVFAPHVVGRCTLNQVDPEPITYSLSNP